MIPEIVARDEIIVVGVRTIVEMGTQNPERLWREKFLPRQGEIAGIARCYYGVFSHLSDDNKGGLFEYVAGMAVDSLNDIPTGMVGWVIPAGKYAETEAAGMGNIAQVCRDLIADWLPDSGYKLLPSPMFAYTKSENPAAASAIWKIDIPMEKPEVLAQLGTWLR